MARNEPVSEPRGVAAWIIGGFVGLAMLALVLTVVLRPF
jgi:hypothetical protein